MPEGGFFRISRFMSEWYHARNGSQSGPVDFETLRTMAAKGDLDAEKDLVWSNGMKDWIAAGKVAGLFDPSFRKLELEKMARIDRSFAGTRGCAVWFAIVLMWPVALIFGVIGLIFCKNKQAKRVAIKLTIFSIIVAIINFLMGLALGLK